MRYQIVKHFKSSSKTVAVVNSMTDAKEYLKTVAGKAMQAGITFDGLSYIGSYPIYSTTPFSTPKKPEHYSIQGLADIGIVCSLKKEDLEKCAL